MMRHFRARDLLEHSALTCWDVLGRGKITLEMDDGVIETNAFRTIFSSYIWDVHRMYPDTPLLIRHHIQKTNITTMTHCDLLGHAIWDCQEHYQFYDEASLNSLRRLAYNITNMIYNDMSSNLEEYVDTMSILDLVDVMMHPKVKAANDRVTTAAAVGRNTINTAYKEILSVLKTPEELPNNAISKIIQHELVRAESVLQSVGPRGFTIDADSYIFNKPVLTGFVEGITDLEGSMKESRSGTLSLYFQDRPMKASEYLNRNLQLSAATFANLHMVNCGSSEYIPYTVATEGYLKDMVGVWHLCPDTNQERAIRPTDKHLIGRTLKVRSVVTCMHPDRNGCCVRCFGQVGLSIPVGDNIGHTSTSIMQERVTQDVLSVKHLVGNSISTLFDMTDFTRRFLDKEIEFDVFRFSDNMRGKSFTLSICEREGSNLNDLNAVENVEELSPSRMTTIQTIYLNVKTGDGGEDEVSLFVGESSRNAYFTTQMLAYIKERQWTINVMGRYVIDMSDWDFAQPFMELPQRQFSTPDYMAGIESFLKGRVTDRKLGTMSLQDYDNFPAALSAFHDLIRQRLAINFSHLQVVVMSFMVQSINNRDYRMPKPPRWLGEFAVHRELMTYRSFGPLMAHEKQAAAIFSPSAYLVTKRPPHPVDILLLEK